MFNVSGQISQSKKKTERERQSEETESERECKGMRKETGRMEEGRKEQWRGGRKAELNKKAD